MKKLKVFILSIFLFLMAEFFAFILWKNSSETTSALVVITIINALTFLANFHLIYNRKEEDFKNDATSMNNQKRSLLLFFGLLLIVISLNNTFKLYFTGTSIIILQSMLILFSESLKNIYHNLNGKKYLERTLFTYIFWLAIPLCIDLSLNIFKVNYNIFFIIIPYFTLLVVFALYSIISANKDIKKKK